MKKGLTILLVLVVAAGLGIELAQWIKKYRSQNSPPLKNETILPTRPPAPTPLAPHPSVRLSVKRKRLPAAPPTSNAPTAAFRSKQLFEKGWVRFKVEEGFAITMGDVLLGQVEDVRLNEGYNEPQGFQLWPTATIPYAIDPKVESPERILNAIQYFSTYTPVHFVPFEGEEDAVVFVPAEENCNSFLGQIGGHQPIRLSPQCGTPEILHEMMHALGFIHEQMRADRDEFVEILWDNIDPEKEDQFYKAPDLFMLPLKGTNFDFTSVMMYSPQTFARSPEDPTMRSLSGQSISPTKTGLSGEDIRRLEIAYGSR